MRISQTPPSLVSLLVLCLSTASPASASPFAREALRHLGFSWIEDRGTCASYCGAQLQYCCEAGEACYTNAANIAYCSAGTAGSGGYAVYTTTWTDTVTRTSTVSSYYQGAQATTAAPPICTTSLGQSSCGKICCAADQRCATAGSCTGYTSTYIAVLPTSYSAPVKGTSSGGVLIATTVASITTTQTFLPAASASGTSFPITASSSNNGLSGGAIAGIVIGVIAGIMLLLLLCFCCIVKAGFSGLLALLGLGKRKERTERVEVTERYSRHGSAAGSRREHVGWFGGSRPTKVDEKRKEKSSFGGLGMVGAGLIGLAAVLGLKRSADKKKAASRTERSDISSSYYTDSYTGTSASSASSDRHTRRTSDTRHTRR